VVLFYTKRKSYQSTNRYKLSNKKIHMSISFGKKNLRPQATECFCHQLYLYQSSQSGQWCDQLWSEYCR